MNERDGTIKLTTTAAADDERSNLLPHLISGYKNSMNQGSLQLIATLFRAPQLLIYKVNSANRQLKVWFSLSVVFLSTVILFPIISACYVPFHQIIGFQ